jgi:hypothetical protein
VPNQRSENQWLLNFWAKISFIKRFNLSLSTLGYSDRSKFIRAAIKEKLEREGFDVPAEEIEAPVRYGKIDYKEATLDALRAKAALRPPEKMKPGPNVAPRISYRTAAGRAADTAASILNDKIAAAKKRRA